MKKLNLFLIGILIISIISCTKEEPVVSTAPIVESETTTANAEITFTTIKISGKITPNENNEVTSRGVCWSTNPNPTINDAKKNETSNTFYTIISDLTVNTKYYFRVFAITDLGVSYSENLSFNTLPLSNTVWKFATYYPPSQYSTGITLYSRIDFYKNNTTRFDELDLPLHCPGCFIAYGTWSLKGNTLTYIWEGSDPNSSTTYIYTGTLTGMTMSGSFKHPSTPGTWTATLL
jgi:hypothetical protein